MRTHPSPALCIALAVLLPACSDMAGGGARAVVRDSAGVQIVESSAPAWREGEGWRLSAEPVLDIGAYEGDANYQLYRANDALRLPDGRIVVANGGTHQLRFYAADGEYLSASGREGDGPGEFRSLGWLTAAGPDSLMVYDWGNRRVSVFDAQGGFSRSFRLEPPGDAGSPSPAGRFVDGSLLVALNRTFMAGAGERSGLHRDSVLHLRYSPEGSVLDTVGRFPGPEALVRAEGRSIGVTSAAFGRNPARAVRGSRLYFGSSDTYEIGVYDEQGALRRLIRRAHTNLPVTEEDIAEYRRRQLEEADARWRQFTERMLAAMPYPATFPAYAGFLLDEAGNLWVREYARPAETGSRWTVFDPDGRMLGSLGMPERFRPTQIGDGFVLGLWRDELDVEHVRMYAIEKP